MMKPTKFCCANSNTAIIFYKVR